MDSRQEELTTQLEILKDNKEQYAENQNIQKRNTDTRGGPPKNLPLQNLNPQETRADERFMKSAIKEAKKAEALGEVPIGCVIVYQDKIIARGYNKRITDKNVLSHAELTAIKKACKKLGDWRLEECTMYVTLEPCPMCAGAIVQARIPEVVIGCMNPKAGCAGSVLDMFHEEGFNHQVKTRTGILEEACSQMLTMFFKALRQAKQEKKKQQQKKEALP